MKVKVVLEEQPEGGYTVYCPAFPGCVSEGETKKEAIENFLDALEGWLVVKMKVAGKQERRRSSRCEIVEVTI